MKSFQALAVSNEPQFSCKIVEKNFDDLPAGEVTIQIAYSGVNYKDALASIENGGVIRSYPMTPGIDASGVVLESSDKRFSKGDKVLVSCYGFGVSHPGGYSEVQRVPADWIVRLPAELSLKEAMMFGTAGYTAALCVEAIQQAGAEKDSSIIITGASGGVGSISLAMLKKIGYKNITASSRKTDTQEWLEKNGAVKVVAPEDLMPEKIRPLAKQQFDYVIDTVGGKITEALLPMIRYGGAMALCGNAGGIQLHTTVMPFILRGVSLLGIDAVNTPIEARQKLWNRLATDLNVLDDLKVSEVPFENIHSIFDALLEGKHIGRTIIRIGGDLA